MSRYLHTEVGRISSMNMMEAGYSMQQRQQQHYTPIINQQKLCRSRDRWRVQDRSRRSFTALDS
jgi:hypothetical protein